MKAEPNSNMDPEAREALIARAALGPLTHDDAVAWVALVRQEPGVLREMEALQSMADLLRALNPVQGGDPASLMGIPVSGRVLARLEGARAQGLPSEEAQAIPLRPMPKPSSWLQMVNDWITQGLLSAGPLAALGVLIVLGIVITRPDGGSVDGLIPGEPSRVVKSGVQTDFPLATPGAVTRITTPSLFWVSLSSSSAKVILKTGGTTIAEATGPSTPMDWTALKTPPLTPGANYRFTVTVEGKSTEKDVFVSPDAQTLASWANSPDAVALVAMWLDENPADSLILATALAEIKAATPELNDLRKKAFQAALDTAETKKAIPSNNSSSNHR